MALRNIRILGDEILKKQAKEVTEMTPKIEELIDDMFETMYDANGCGLAAPQVGIRKRIVVIDCGDQPLVLINPEILAGILKETKNIQEYTIREKTAKILSKIKNNPELSYIKSELKNDRNYYVRRF